jgi:hypothetical protein
MHLITARASDAVVIAKNSAERQCEVKGIPISVPLTGYPLNNYQNFMRRMKSNIHASINSDI